MKLKIETFTFHLANTILDNEKIRIQKLTEKLHKTAISAGKTSDAYKQACTQFEKRISTGIPLEECLNTGLDVRVLNYFLGLKISKLTFTAQVFQKINTLRPRPSLLTIEAFYDYFLNHFEHIENVHLLIGWIKWAKKERETYTIQDDFILSLSAPKWFIEESVRKGISLEQQLESTNLDKYRSGELVKTIYSIYYIERLKQIPTNQSHKIFEKIKAEKAYLNKFDQSSLIGHHILKILIERSPAQEIHESWFKLIMHIAGDPRVPKSSKKYSKWWSQIDEELKQKMHGWLSKIDLELFLEVLEVHANESDNYELKRMFPARKIFMEGLLKKNLITNTRLYLSSHAERYLKRSFNQKELPVYSTVNHQNKSIIYFKVGHLHLIEGSYNCYLWIHSELDSSAIVFNYNKKKNIGYSQLTTKLNQYNPRITTLAKITHNPIDFNWQKKAIGVFQKQGINVLLEDVIYQSRVLQKNTAIKNEIHLPNKEKKRITQEIYIPDSKSASKKEIADVRPDKKDLKYLLGVLKKEAESSYIPSLNKWYPFREKFMLGLLQNNVITYFQVFLSKNVLQDYLSSNSNEEIKYFKSDHQNISYIYYQVGKLHFIESSYEHDLLISKTHNKVMPCFHQNHLTSFDDLKSILGSSVKKIVHKNKYSLWQREVVQFLRERDIKISIKDVLSKKDYAACKHLVKDLV